MCARAPLLLWFILFLLTICSKSEGSTAGTADSNINIRYCLLSGHVIKQLQVFNNPPLLDVTRRIGTQHRPELPAATLAWHNNNEYSGSKEHLPFGSTKALYNEQ